jgi:hypothetical protein
LSIFELINRFGYFAQPHTLWGYDVSLVLETVQKVRAVYQRLQPPDTDPMLDFDERDLIANEAGQLIAYLRPMVESKQGTHRSAIAYLWAIKD